MWTAVYVPHSFLTAGIRCSLPVCIAVCWVRDLWGVWHHLSPSSSMCCHIRADYSLPSVRSSFWPLCSVVLTFWPVQVLHLYVWIKLQVCWSLIRNMYSVCALSWYFVFFQALSGEDWKGAIPDRDQRPAGPAVRDARWTRYSQEISRWWREDCHDGGNSLTSV